MALFQGEEMIDVTTPDGRTLTLPRSIVPASLMPQISAAPAAAPLAAPAAPSAPATAPPIQPADFAGLEVAPETAATPNSVVEMGEPGITPVTVMDEMVVKPNPKRLAKMRKQDAAYKASPAGKQAAAQAQVASATEGAEQAISDAADVEAAAADLVYDVKVQGNADIAKREADRDKAMTEALAAEDAKMNEVVNVRKKIENTKIDRKLDHPMQVAIGAALMGIGQALSGQKVTTYEVILNAIDRKVAAQEADLERMAKVYGLNKDELEMLRTKSQRKLEFHNTMIAAEANKAARTIEELTARSASEKIRANGAQAIAQLRQLAADKTMDAVRWGLEYDQRDKHQKAQIGLGYANLSESKRQFNENIKQREADRSQDLLKALAADRSKGDLETYKMRMEAIKENRQFGVRDMSGNFILSKEGRAKVAQAKALEEQAAKLEADPNIASRAIGTGKAAMLRQQAAILRGDAESFDPIKAHNETEAVAVSNMVSSGQSVVQLIDGIRELSDQAGRGIISRSEAQSKLKSMFSLLKPGLKEAWQLGAWDKGSAGLVAEIIGLDPSAEWDVGVIGAIVGAKMYENPEAFKQGLNAVAEDLEVRAKNKLVGIGAKFDTGDTVLRRKALPIVSPSAIELSKNPTGTELQKGAEESALRSRMLNLPSFANPDAGQSLRYPGLGAAQEKPFEERLKAYRAGDKRAGEELVALVAEAATSRPNTAIPILHNLRDHAPDLYRVARSAVPKGSPADQQMTYEENTKIGNATTPPAIVARRVMGSIDVYGNLGDKEGYADLARRASQGDPIAKKALVDIASQIGANRTLPRGKGN